MREARPAQPAATARFPRRPGPASEPTARSSPPTLASRRPAPPHQRGPAATRERDVEGAARRARGGRRQLTPRRRGGHPAWLLLHRRPPLAGPGLPGRAFCLRAAEERRGLASPDAAEQGRRRRSRRSCLSHRRHLGRHSAGGTGGGPWRRDTDTDRQTDTHRYLVTSARPGPSALRAPRPTRTAGRLRIPHATVGALGGRAGREETPTPSVRCAREGRRPRGWRRCLLGVVVFPTGPRPAPPRPAP